MCSYGRGSVDVTIQGPQSVATVVDAQISSLAQGPSSFGGVPVISAVNTGGRAVSSPSSSSSSGSPLWIIGVVFAVLIVVALAIIIVVIVIKKRSRDSSDSSSYHRLSSEKLANDTVFSSGGERFTALISHQAHAQPPSVVHVTIQSAVQAMPSENVMGCAQGEALSIDPQDWDSVAEWVWAVKDRTGESGYVPRSFCVGF